MNPKQFIEETKEYIEFSEEDAKKLKELKPIMEKHKEEVARAFYATLQRSNEAKKFLANEELIQKLKGAFQGWFLELFDGTYGEKYAERRMRIGLAHVRIGLKQMYMMAAAGSIEAALMLIIEKHYASDPKKMAHLMASLNKILSLDLNLMCEGYLRGELIGKEMTSLEKFLAVTGFSRALYEKLTASYDASGFGKSAIGIQWSDALATGMGEIDAQHKELFSRINALFDAVVLDMGKEETAKVIEFLADYVVTHFGTEEKYMTQHGYPEYPSHKAQHVKFIEDFSSLRKRFESEGASELLIMDTQRKVVDWLINHIGKVDKALGAFLKTKM